MSTIGEETSDADSQTVLATSGSGATGTSHEPYIPNGVCVCFPEYDKTTMGNVDLNSATIQIKNDVKNRNNKLVEPGFFKVTKTNGKWEVANPINENDQKVYDSFIGKETPSEQIDGGSGKYIRQTKSKKSKRRKGGRSKRRPLR